MKKVIDITKDLNNEERNLLSIAYKNTVGQRRTAWRAITAYEIKEKQKVNTYIHKRQLNILKFYIITKQEQKKNWIIIAMKFSLSQILHY